MACAEYTYDENVELCSVSPYNIDFVVFGLDVNYPLEPGSCCSAYENQGVPSLLEECVGSIESMVCQKEVYEN